MRPLVLLLLLNAGLAVPEAASAEADGLRKAVRRFEAQEVETAEKLLLTTLESRPENAEAAYYLGRVYLEQGRAKAAVETLEQAARLDPTVSAHQFWLGEALVERIEDVSFVFKLGLAKRMRKAYEKAVELDPENLEARVSVARYHSEAPAIAGGSTERAAAEIAEIERRDPALGHVTRGLIHEQLKRLDEAAKAFEAAVEVDPESILSWREAGYFYQRRDRWGDAQRAFDAVLALAPEDPAALYETARTAIKLGERHLERAEETLRAYLRLPPGPDPMVLGTAEPPRRSVARERLKQVRQRLRRPDPAAEE